MMELGRGRTEQSDTQHAEDCNQPPNDSTSMPGVHANALKRRQISRAEFVALLSSRSGQTKTLNNAEVNFGALYQAFVHLYFPKPRDMENSRTIESLFSAATSNDALSESVKAAGLVVLHRTNKDPALLDAAKEMYSNALCRTRRQLGNPQTDKRAMIGVAHMLTVCEMLSSEALTDTGSRAHARWIVSSMGAGRVTDLNVPGGLELWGSYLWMLAIGIF